MTRSFARQLSGCKRNVATPLLAAYSLEIFVTYTIISAAGAFQKLPNVTSTALYPLLGQPPASLFPILSAVAFQSAFRCSHLLASSLRPKWRP